MSKNTNKPTISFKPKQVTKKLMAVLNDRARDVIESRYGLGKDTQKMTLESIGQKYGITRERVRQIENYSLSTIRKSEAYQKEIEAFDELKEYVDSMGAMLSEDELLLSISNNQSAQNHIHFLLVLGDYFVKEKECEEFRHRWHVDSDLADSIHESLRKLYQGLEDDELVSEPDIIKSFLKHLEDVSDRYRSEEIAKRWLNISKTIDKNELGEWGRADSPNINTKGIRDYAFLVIRKHGSPIHFREVAESIEKTFNKKAHVATTHNELIKDGRFVLVGRGLYALKDWGYTSGIVRDVIHKILQEKGPLTKSEIIDEVLKERYVKENTVSVNLQNPKYFKKDKQGRYLAI